jgi:hypothetical protein
MSLEDLEKRVEALEGLEKRVKVIEDIEEIKKLQLRYVNALTTVDWDEVVDCFAEDGVADLTNGRAKGKEQLYSLFREKISGMHQGLEGNFVVHPIVEVEGDRARGSWLLYIQFCRPRPLPQKFLAMIGNETPDWMQGYYEMEYVREKGKWKISLLRWRRRLLSPRPLQERT